MVFPRASWPQRRKKETQDRSSLGSHEMGAASAILSRPGIYLPPHATREDVTWVVRSGPRHCPEVLVGWEDYFNVIDYVIFYGVCPEAQHDALLRVKDARGFLVSAALYGLPVHDPIDGDAGSGDVGGPFGACGGEHGVGVDEEEEM